MKALPPEESGRAGEIVVDDVLGCVLPGRLAVFFHGNGPESGWNVPDQVQAFRWHDARGEKFWATYGSSHSLPTAVRKCADGVCAEDTTQMLLFLKQQNYRENGRQEIVVVQLEEKKADHRAAFKQ